MSDVLLPPLAIERQMKQNEYFYKLCQIAQDARSMPTAELDNDQLESLSVCVLDELNIDDDSSPVDSSPIDSAPRYFVPMAHDKLDEYCTPELCRRADREWERLCQGENEMNLPPRPGRLEPGCDAYTDACCRGLWVVEMFGYDSRLADTISSQTGWKHPISKIRYDACCMISSSHHSDAGMHKVFHDERVPHSSVLVQDTHVSGSILRSEVVAAAQYIKEQIRYWQHIDHHTIPILLVTIQHDCAARITQVHFDGERLFFRPSRTLDLASDTPTDDAYQMVRWLGSTPVGDTAYESDTAYKSVGTAYKSVDTESVDTESVDTELEGQPAAAHL